MSSNHRVRSRATTRAGKNQRRASNGGRNLSSAFVRACASGMKRMSANGRSDVARAVVDRRVSMDILPESASFLLSCHAQVMRPFYPTLEDVFTC